MPDRSPERQRLAAALDRLADARANLARTERAAERVHERFNEFNRIAVAADRELADARRDEGGLLVDALLADREPRQSPLKSLEAALADAREQREAASAAGNTLRAQLEVEQRAVDNARRDVRQAAALVLAASPATAAAVERLERAQAELVDASDEVLWLIRADVIFARRPPPGDIETDVALAGRASSATILLQNNPVGWTELIQERLPCAATRAWESALEALQVDPDAEVPHGSA